MWQRRETYYIYFHLFEKSYVIKQAALRLFINNVEDSHFTQQNVLLHLCTIKQTCDIPILSRYITLNVHTKSLSCKTAACSPNNIRYVIILGSLCRGNNVDDIAVLQLTAAVCENLRAKSSNW